jgi:hypothetical protein
LSNCPISHVAIYDNSLMYNLLTRDEYLTCVAGKRCTASSPSLASSIDNCAARQYMLYGLWGSWAEMFTDDSCCSMKMTEI